MATRNPSPPPDIDPTECDLPDQIGESAFSKRWLYSLTLQVLTAIQSEPLTAEEDEQLSSQLEEELCCLWDVTTDKELLPHLREFQLIPVFAECIVRSRSPRLTVSRRPGIPFTFFQSTECGGDTLKASSHRPLRCHLEQCHGMLWIPFPLFT